LWKQDEDFFVQIFGGSFAEVVQLIAAMKSAKFLTPDMASGYPTSERIDAISGIVFFTPCLASKS